MSFHILEALKMEVHHALQKQTSKVDENTKNNMSNSVVKHGFCDAYTNRHVRCDVLTAMKIIIIVPCNVKLRVCGLVDGFPKRGAYKNCK
jgi:hypothetical protein